MSFSCELDDPYSGYKGNEWITVLYEEIIK